MKKNILLLFMFICTTAFTQTNEEAKTEQTPKWKMVADVQYVTQHYWRGLGRGPLFGKAPAFEPNVMFIHKHWNIGVVAAGSFDGVYKAVVQSVSFSPVKNLWVGVWDIYSPGKKMWTAEAKPFDFGLNTSNHFIDAVVSYELPWLPLTLKWTSIVAGKDPNLDGDRNFTSYGEISYKHKWNQSSIWGGIGATPWSGLYHRANGGINNLEMKVQYDFKLYQPVTMPLFVKIAYNPLSDKFHFIGGASIKIPYSFK